EAGARAYLAQRDLYIGESQRAIEMFRRDALERVDHNTWEYMYCVAVLINALAAPGRFAEGMAIGDELLQLATTSNRPARLVQAYGCLGPLYTQKGDIDRAISLLERGREVSRTWKLMSGWDVSILESLGQAYRLAGRVDEALPLLKEAVEQREAI